MTRLPFLLVSKWTGLNHLPYGMRGVLTPVHAWFFEQDMVFLPGAVLGIYGFILRRDIHTGKAIDVYVSSTVHCT